MNFAQDIQSSLDTVNFIKLVRPLCVLTQGSSFITDDDILFQGYNQFNNIGLVLSAAKDKDNTQLFKIPTTYQAVLGLMTNSEYSSGLVNVAAELTAANIIRSLPLNDSLKLIERGNTLETRAYSNLDRIIFLYTSASAVSTNVSISTSNDFFFFSPDIDRTTLLDSQFDVGLETESVKLTGVKTVKTLSVDPNQVSFIYYNILKSEPGTPPLLNEGITIVNNGQDIENFIYQLSSDINTLCTNVYSTGTAAYPFSNLIAEPTRTQNIDSTISIKKSNFYTNTATFLNKAATFTLRTFSVYLEFAARRLSTNVSREAITIRPLTIHKASLLTPYTSYKGTYSTTTLYSLNDVVISNNIGYKVILASPPVNSITNTTYWQQLNVSNVSYTSNDLLVRKSTYIKNYVDGLLIGKQTSNYFNYQSLQLEGPLSAIIDVNKGTVSSASATTTGSTSIDHKVEIDTFYFSYSNPLTPYCTSAGTLLFRISTLFEDVPWIPINIELGDQPEDVAFKLLQGILEYRVEQDTKVVGAQIYKDAVYINAYKITNPEVRVVVDIKFENVGGITVASYYHLVAPAITSYATAPRSVAVTTTLRVTNNPSTDQTINKGASAIDFGSRSNSTMNRVKDKIALLNDVIGSQYAWSR
jgi:hypothetical protein